VTADLDIFVTLPGPCPREVVSAPESQKYEGRADVMEHRGATPPLTYYKADQRHELAQRRRPVREPQGSDPAACHTNGDPRGRKVIRPPQSPGHRDAVARLTYTRDQPEVSDRRPSHGSDQASAGAKSQRLDRGRARRQPCRSRAPDPLSASPTQPDGRQRVRQDRGQM